MKLLCLSFRTSFVFLWLIVFVFSNCRKQGDQPLSADYSNDRAQSDFFDSYPSADSRAAILKDKLLRLDQQYHFSGSYLDKVGIPRWDKIADLNGAFPADSNNDPGQTGGLALISCIPFVKPGINRVEAMLLVKVQDGDTTFRLLHANEYAAFGFREGADAPSGARSVFCLFAEVNNKIFGLSRYIIRDPRLLSEEETRSIAELGVSWEGVRLSRRFEDIGGQPGAGRAVIALKCYQVSYCVEYGLKPFKGAVTVADAGYQPETSHAPCVSWGTYQQCVINWISALGGTDDFPGGGDNGMGDVDLPGGGSAGQGSFSPVPRDPCMVSGEEVSEIPCDHINEGWEVELMSQAAEYENILEPGDSYLFNVNMDPASALVFNSVAEFSEYKEQLTDAVTYDADQPADVISQQEKTERARFNLNFVGGVDVSVTLEKKNDLWQVKAISSDTWGLTPAVSWSQSATDKNLSGNQITVGVVGKLSYHVIVRGIGTIYRQQLTFQVKIDNRTGKITSLAKL